MFDWFFTPNNTSSKVIAITIGTIKYCYNIQFVSAKLNKLQLKSNLSYVYLGLMSCIGYSPCLLNLFVSLRSELIFALTTKFHQLITPSDFS